MDSLHDLLTNKDFDEPPEIAAIKHYVHSTYQVDVSVQLRDQTIVVLLKSAALASRLRMNLPALQKAADTDKRIVLRIND